jgi:hypothetical protein
MLHMLLMESKCVVTLSHPISCMKFIIFVAIENKKCVCLNYMQLVIFLGITLTDNICYLASACVNYIVLYDYLQLMPFSFRRLSWADVVKPASKIASDGFKVSKSLGELLIKKKHEVTCILMFNA